MCSHVILAVEEELWQVAPEVPGPVPGPGVVHGADLALLAAQPPHVVLLLHIYSLLYKKRLFTCHASTLKSSQLDLTASPTLMPSRILASQSEQSSPRLDQSQLTWTAS